MAKSVVTDERAVNPKGGLLRGVWRVVECVVRNRHDKMLCYRSTVQCCVESLLLHA